jgi:hypothetical protein
MELKDKKYASTTRRKFDLEEEHKVRVALIWSRCAYISAQQIMSKLDVDNYTLSRIPRPSDTERK